MAHIRSESTKRAEWALVAALLLLAGAARFAGLGERTVDLQIFVGWHHQLGAHGLGREIGNYNAPFLYLLALTLYLPGPVYLKIKILWLVFDLVLALFAYAITRELRGSRRRATAVTLAVLLLPTVVINASFWGQMDAMWASFALGGVYFLLREKPWWAVVLCTLSLAVKPQGIFVFPLLLLLALAGRLPWRTLLAAPAVFVALDLPAILAGRDPIELLTIYDLGRQARHVPALTLRAPSLYAFVPATGDHVDALRTLGTILAAAVVLGVCWALIARGRPIPIVPAAALFAILLPFVLPGMHERYFFLADVLTVLLVATRPRLWFVPLLVQAASLLCYQPYLFGGRTPQMLPLEIPALLMLAALLVVLHDLLKPPRSTWNRRSNRRRWSSATASRGSSAIRRRAVATSTAA